MYEKRVSRGAKWLDKVCPDWYTKVNLSRLNLTDHNCVIGQSLGDFSEVINGKFLISPDLKGKKLLLHPGVYIGVVWMIANGFDIGPNSSYCTDAWRKAWGNEIEKRQEANWSLYVPTEWVERIGVPS